MESDEAPQPERTLTSSPSGSNLEVPPPPPKPGPYEWLRLTDVIFAAFLGGVPRAVSWSAASLLVLSFPDLTAAVPCAIWYLALESKDPSSQNPWHTINLSGDRPWKVHCEQTSVKPKGTGTGISSKWAAFSLFIAFSTTSLS
ncbi:hypothetical protein LXA43DRAFT_1062982 [Ganoderma leucocontextum]|nr:hypothetical protein LXA43DRAFT_1062982 [Ganoderma leucocontextum]